MEDDKVITVTMNKLTASYIKDGIARIVREISEECFPKKGKIDLNDDDMMENCIAGASAIKDLGDVWESIDDQLSN